jgi:hypothetical protein
MQKDRATADTSRAWLVLAGEVTMGLAWLAAMLPWVFGSPPRMVTWLVLVSLAGSVATRRLRTRFPRTSVGVLVAAVVVAGAAVVASGW